MKQLIRFGPHTDYQKGVVINFVSKLDITENKEYEVTVKPYKLSKSDEQRGYYFSTVVKVAAEWQGLTAKDAHEFLKQNCCFKLYFSDLLGNAYEYRPSIKDMKLPEMSKYIDDCINFMGREGQYVPPPAIR